MPLILSVTYMISVWSTYLMKMENYYLDVKDWGNLIGTNICTKLKV